MSATISAPLSRPDLDETPVSERVVISAAPCSNRVRNGRFWHSAVHFRTARKILLAVALACCAPVSADADAPTSSFLKLTKEQRYWWIHGAVSTTAHLVAMRDKQKGDCAAKWFLEQKEAKQALIEQTIARNPSESPTTTVLVLLTKACGDLLPR